MATTLRHVLLTYHPERGAPITVRLNSEPNHPKRFVAIYRTEADAKADGLKPDCRIRLRENGAGYLEEVSTPPGAGGEWPMKNDPGCIRFADGSWWCPDKDSIG